MYDSAHAENKEIVLMEDTNLNFLKPKEVLKRWYKIMDSYNLSQIINEPTRY